MEKKLFIVTILILALALCSICLAIPIADPQNLHNMSSSAQHSGPKASPVASGGTDQICVFCHTPHSAAPQSPLWNRLAPNTMGSFPLYAQDLAIKQDPARTGYNTATNPEYPSGASRLCLSCHDGVTAIGILRGNETIAMPAGSDFITKVTAVIDLAKSHPISFYYNSDVRDNVLNIWKPGAYQLPPDGDGIDTPLDGAGRMQCTTCHDPHEDTRGSIAYGNLPFWRHAGNAASYDDVCNSCHTLPTDATPPPIHNIPPP